MKFAWFLLATPLLGQLLSHVQFSNLATSRDGKILYFSSPLSLRGDDEQPYQKIFRIDSAGIHPVVQIERTGPDFPNFSNFYLAIEPDLSGDGSVFSYVASRTCVGGSACVFFELYESHVLAGGVETVYSGRTRLSRDGRYALRYDSTGVQFPSDPVPALTDLSTGARTAVPGMILEGRALASGGTVLTFIDNALVLWKRTGSTPVSVSAYGRAVLSDNAAVIAVESGPSFGPPPLSLFLYDTVSGESSLLDRGSTNGYDASVTDDGRLICYLRNSQVVLFDRTKQSEVPLGATPDGVVEAVISGDGSTIWEASGAGRILRVDVASGSAQEVVPRTPWIDSMQGAAVPGSLNWVEGSGLSDGSTTLPLPLPEFALETNGWLSLLVGSIPGRLVHVTPNEILYQIPFEVPPGTWALRLYPNDSPFDQPSLSIDVVPFAPQPVALPLTNETVIANSNFSALINEQNPAHPGEAIHVYFTGLGSVSPLLLSGVPAPLNLLEPVVQKPDCQVSTGPGQTQPAQILFAGMAPGFVGIYQVDIRLPSVIPIVTAPDGNNGVALFTCDSLSLVYAFTVPMESGQN